MTPAGKEQHRCDLQPDKAMHAPHNHKTSLNSIVLISLGPTAQPVCDLAAIYLDRPENLFAPPVNLRVTRIGGIKGPSEVIHAKGNDQLQLYPIFQKYGIKLALTLPRISYCISSYDLI